jgi:hypothetical protein
MATASELPVLVTADAEDRIQALGLQRELATILEHTKQTVPGLRAVEVTPFFDSPFAPHLMITVYKEQPQSGNDDLVRRDWDAWLMHTFPSHVAEWFLFDVDYRTDHVW